MLEIITLGNDILRKPSALVADFDQGIVDFSQALIETLGRQEGIGLAAPQVGQSIRMFVTHVKGDIPRVFINPEIVGTSIELSEYEEGCLSIPGIWADVTRPKKVSIQAWNEKGKMFTLDAEGILARVIQHEYDHLRGVLFIDHLEEKRRARALKFYGSKTGAR